MKITMNIELLFTLLALASGSVQQSVRQTIGTVSCSTTHYQTSFETMMVTLGSAPASQQPNMQTSTPLVKKEEPSSVQPNSAMPVQPSSSVQPNSAAPAPLSKIMCNNSTVTVTTTLHDCQTSLNTPVPSFLTVSGGSAFTSARRPSVVSRSASVSATMTSPKPTTPTKANPLVAPDSTTPSSQVAPTSETPRITGRLMTPTPRLITTSLLRYIPQTTIMTSEIYPTPQCILVTPSEAKKMIHTVRMTTSTWIQTVVPEGGSKLLAHLAKKRNAQNEMNQQQNEQEMDQWATTWSTGWTKVYQVRDGVTEEVRPTAA